MGEKTITWTGDYEELEQFLRNFHNIKDDPGTYDVNGVVQLMLALLENLQENANRFELREIADALTDEQHAFFLRISASLIGSSQK